MKEFDQGFSSSMKFAGGSVFDAESSSLSLGSVVVESGRIVDPDTAPSVGTTFDAGGHLVAPGFVDLHTHVFRGQRHSVDARVIGPPAGTTTMIDAGSAGAQFIDALRITTFEDEESPRVRAFLNISVIGTAAEFRGELRGLAFCDERAALEAIEAHPDLVVGVKVRASADVGGADVIEALGRARRVADLAGLPLMCHLGPAPATLSDILRQLRDGDILTHAFTGFSDNHVARDAQTLMELRQAADRGVVLDVGHGQSGFSFGVASAVLEAGIRPTTISTDLHRGSVDALGGLPNVMTKFLALGLSPAEVLARVTVSPARVVGLDREGVGTLEPGSSGDVVVLRLDDVAQELADAFGGRVSSQQAFRPVLTVQRGQVVYDDGSLPRSAS